MQLEPLSKSSYDTSNPYFNTEAAISVTKWYLESDRDVANMVMSDIICKRVRDIVRETGPEIDAIITKSFEEKFELLKKTIANGVINKSMSDETVDATVQAIEIVKAYTSYDRTKIANKRKRNALGHFAPEGHSTFTPPAMHGAEPAARNKAQHENAKTEADKALKSLGEGKERTATVHYTDDQGNARADTVRGSKATQFVGSDEGTYFGGEKGPAHQRITSIDWFGDEGKTGYESAYNLLNGETAGAYNRAGDVKRGESGTTRNARQLGAFSQGLDELGVGTVGGPKVQAALMAGQMVGELGPEAERYAGPSIRRMGYRYRGTERTPDEKMLRSLKASGNTREQLLMLGSNKEYSMEDTTMGVERVPVPNKFLGYFQGQLANPKLINLQTNSGAIAPSEGVILSRDGQVVTQAVGYGDDHYLPFNMRKLAKAKGGDYVRTRTLGGPTTEDIYAGMISGARSMTVVSHSGVFTIEFDPAFRGGRRLNDKAARMTKKYGQLVDSLASGQVKTDDVPQDRRVELKERVAMEIPGDTPQIQQDREQKYKDLLSIERKNPQPSEAMREAWTEEFGATIADKYDSGDGSPMSWSHLKAQAGIKAGQPIETDREAISVLGLDAKYEKFTQSKERAYKRENSPLRLNGEGYRDAISALQEQFPYYIKEVNWIPPGQGSPASGRNDVGYVKPKHLRAEKIQEGYFDPSVEGYMNDKGTGKRTADRENYSNQGAYRRLERQYNKGGTADVTNTDGTVTPGKQAQSWESVKSKRRKESFSQGGGSQANSSTSSTATITRSTTGAVGISGFGPTYSGFSKSPHLSQGKDSTDYDVLQQAIKIRSSLRSMGRIAYVDPQSQEQKAFEPFGPTGNAVGNTNVLLKNPKDDSAFEDDVITGKISMADLRGAIKGLSNASGGTTGQEAAMATALTSKGVLKDLAPGNPKSALSLATDLANGMKKNYDFTRNGRDGMAYLPGLAKREYKAAWVTDTDVSSFAASAERRFGYDMGLNTHQSTFNKMSVNMGKAAREALNLSQDWDRQNKQYGGASNVPGTHTVKYGGKTYSNYGVADLQKDVANDVLAVAKMTQLKRMYGSSDEHPDKGIQDGEKVISLDEVNESKDREDYFDNDKDPRDKPVGDLKFGTDSKEFGSQGDRKPKKVQAVQIAGDSAKLEAARKDIHSLVGLDTVKTEFDDLIKESRINQYRASKGLKTRPTTKHLIFSGDPGTGKTTVAEKLGTAYNAMGLIPSDQMMVVTRADLVSPYQGQTAKKVKDTFTKGKGGVIFIDEAYSLINGSDDSYGYEAVDELVNQVERNRDDTVVILAGYPKEMEGLMGANPGLKSRFPRTMHFPNYSASELKDIGTLSIGNNDYTLAANAKAPFKAATAKIAASPGMANARDVRNFNDAISREQTRRISKIPRESLDTEVASTITGEDVRNASKKYFSTRTNVTKRLVAL